ncbi:3-deoxy-manno-octulosonate cytidylyltransferase [Nitratireductor luteus]|uniref:3-deoxy-manno-octulosonate cytidylyltransferase n=1 Tax=Nitratireductor luteus TaxID=2976980 RepID=UPI00224069D7|nr:3-deoxy-manno-octulosonate cytidylyltransferase [Nitratireductor luteus]
MKAIVLIPARMASTRLPGKPLADIGGKAMILHVAERAREAGLGRVVVATDTREIAAAAEADGVESVMTRSDHQSGSDRIFEALNRVDPNGEADIVINLQGDLPAIPAADIIAAAKLLEAPETDIGTLGVEIRDEAEKTNPSVVKIIGTPKGGGDLKRLRALYFTRATAPWGEGPLYHHIGIYAYRRGALERFVALPPSPLELRERLEQLRALEAGMCIDVGLVDSLPLGVDTPEDLERARDILKDRQG